MITSGIKVGHPVRRHEGEGRPNAERAAQRRAAVRGRDVRIVTMSNKLWMGAMHIVEWLRDDDRIRTGWDLYNELEPIGITYRPPFAVRFHPVKGRAEFMAALDQVQEEPLRTNRVPLLHIETHGSGDGIGPGGENILVNARVRGCHSCTRTSSSANAVTATG
jgi:hypothetical protein